jgi:hypothetical protein
MSSQIKFSQASFFAFAIFFSLLCMPVFAQNTSPAPSDTTNQFVQIIANIVKAGIDYFVQHFDSIFKFFVANILPPLWSIVKAVFNAFFNKSS